MAAIIEARGPSDVPVPEFGLTIREREVLSLVCDGLSSKSIAARLSISPWTVAQHLGSIFSKTGVSSRSELLSLLLTRVREAA